MEHEAKDSEGRGWVKGSTQRGVKSEKEQGNNMKVGELKEPQPVYWGKETGPLLLCKSIS